METTPARYIMIGGFLGAGKTTSVLKLAHWLDDTHGLRVGLIDNDQGSQLVDTALLASHDYEVEEISGGCFCCRFNSLVEAADRLNKRTLPEVFIAEPVGSCTDLVATVTYPLRRMYGESYTIAPLSVLVDPIRAARVLGLEQGSRFSEKVEYIYRKQLEEADIIVINKRDMLSPEKLTELQAALAKSFPLAKIMTVSARTGEGLEEWFKELTETTQKPRAVMEVDYEVYADGEALLGWLNAAYTLQTEKQTDANEFLRQLAESVRRKLTAHGSEVAHFKMTLEPEDSLGDLAVLNLVRNDYVPELSMELEEPFTDAHLTVNMRAEAAPEDLQKLLADAVSETLVAFPGLTAKQEHLEAFKPGKPQPTHRDV
ncbi:MAG TPA: GTP-binding protein [Verrucomicrobiae bacterium]